MGIGLFFLQFFFTILNLMYEYMQEKHAKCRYIKLGVNITTNVGKINTEKKTLLN